MSPPHLQSLRRVPKLARGRRNWPLTQIPPGGGRRAVLPGGVGAAGSRQSTDPASDPSPASGGTSDGQGPRGRGHPSPKKKKSWKYCRKVELTSQTTMAATEASGTGGSRPRSRPQEGGTRGAKRRSGPQDSASRPHEAKTPDSKRGERG